ncbi:hypothetical protein PVAP13_7KG165855 [Panicum virgatum]|uniref:Uncharacterized protein n=1 Tax=Panicum virgatum TaxID=38727 RepID=A0A8T0QEH0_PANVG|nr:hypothetical protein PVAP13_7KG165855 [Panicum virgatum]
MVLAEIWRVGVVEPTLPPFQLAGPMQLWIQDGNHVRLPFPFQSDLCHNKITAN